MERKILIIDDDERNVFALKAVLKAREFHCVTAFGGAQALDILKHEKEIFLVLADMMMPGMDGYELMRTIRKISSWNHIRLVAVTAQAMPGDMEKCLDAGADDYISKPID
nr:response regulator [Bacteroidota bacterium]